MALTHNNGPWLADETLAHAMVRLKRVKVCANAGTGEKAAKVSAN